MSQVVQYRCDVCQQLSGTTSGWMVVKRNKDIGVMTIQPANTSSFELQSVVFKGNVEPTVLEKWEQLDVCGSQCLCKAISNGQGR